ncbi:11173_t:CDS:10 [Funneliformis geosporum]|uniref:2182_t:CDS:1 n=1 Tax=Funneliformis geosporum TaxID=1117311 RepID=A0A9W4WP00_9GLOM|nr:11173_t:CDS:10 [Funneliformis geosporum]CAI2168033.1 2182_t:CDS:10 [Funneliformis geosporum]
MVFYHRLSIFYQKNLLKLPLLPIKFKSRIVPSQRFYSAESSDKTHRIPNMSIKSAFPDTSNPMVTLAREGPLFIMTMKTGENRFTTKFVEALFGALDEIEKVREENDSEPAALITTGEGKFFSNGLDLEHAISVPGFFDDYYLKLLTRVLTFPIPTVAAINGHAFAGGFMFALAHDYRVMRSDRGFLCMNEVDIPSPLHPGMAAIVRIKMTPKTYRDCILQAHKFTSTEALEQGLVEIIATENEVLEKAKGLGLKWSGKAKAGAIYGSLKQEMYVEGIKHMNLKNWSSSAHDDIESSSALGIRYTISLLHMGEFETNMGHRRCSGCDLLKLQIELKDTIIKSKDEKIALLQEALIKSQRELILTLREDPKQSIMSGRSLSEQNNDGRGKSKLELVYIENDCDPTTEWVHSNQANTLEEYRIYIGSIKSDISKVNLKQALEEQFGRILRLDLVTSKNIAFVTFESYENYNAAVNQGNIYVDGCSCTIQAALYYTKEKVENFQLHSKDINLAKTHLLALSQIEKHKEYTGSSEITLKDDVLLKEYLNYCDKNLDLPVRIYLHYGRKRHTKNLDHQNINGQLISPDLGI